MKERGACDAFRGGNLARILVSRPGRHNILSKKSEAHREFMEFWSAP
jgi:hypothetical protein